MRILSTSAKVIGYWPMTGRPLPTMDVVQALQQKSLSEAADSVGCAEVKIRQLDALCRPEPVRASANFYK
jgi:hypothetical protein